MTHFLHGVDDREYDYDLSDAIEDIWDRDEDTKYLGRAARAYLRGLYINAGVFKPLDVEKFEKDVARGFAPQTNNRVESVSSLTAFIIKGVRYTSNEDYQVTS